MTQDTKDGGLSAIRARAWATRRAKYGERGHAGAYSRWRIDPIARRALALVIRLHEEQTLSEGQLCKALDLDRVEFRRLCDDLAPALSERSG